VRLWNGLRTIGITAAAMVSGAITMATGGGERNPVVLQPGDRAPDFSLVGSDGRTYRLRDFSGRDAVVIAWFPKAFTGG